MIGRREASDGLGEFVKGTVWRQIERSKRARNHDSQCAGGAELGRRVEAGQKRVEQPSGPFDAVPWGNGALDVDAPATQETDYVRGRDSRKVPVLSALNDVPGNGRGFRSLQANAGGRKIS